MFRSKGDPAPGSAPEGKKQRFAKAGIAILSGIVLVCLVAYFGLRGSRAQRPAVPVKESAAELISATGMVLVQNSGRQEWNEIKMGARLSEGDWVRTDTNGAAGIRYKNGTNVIIPQNTVFRVLRSGGNEVEITAPPGSAVLPLLLAGDNGKTDQSEKAPFIELQQIVPFGRSLELIGRVEAGSSLSINGETVEVTGEGLFKHFTKPFAPSAEVIRLNLKVKDLAGRTRSYTATHDFGFHGGSS